MWPGATILDSTDRECLHGHRKFYGQLWCRMCLRAVPPEQPASGACILPSGSLIGVAPAGLDHVLAAFAAGSEGGREGADSRSSWVGEEGEC